MDQYCKHIRQGTILNWKGLEELGLPAGSTVAKQKEVVGIPYISRAGLNKIFTMLGYSGKLS